MPATANEINRRKGYSGSDKTVEVTYQVSVTTANDADSAIAAVEAIGSPAGYKLDDISCSHINRNPMWFGVRATHKQSLSGGGQTDPLERPSILSASYEEWTEAYFQDHTSPTPKRVVNAALDRLDPLPQRKNGSLVLNITKNFASHNLTYYDSIKFTTNSAGVTIKGVTFAADTLLFLPPTTQEVYEGVGGATEHYYTIGFRLAADGGAHLQRFEDRGYKQLVGAPVKSVPILDGTGRPVESPWPLISGGASAGTAKPPNYAADVLTFKPYASASWGIDFD